MRKPILLEDDNNKYKCLIGRTIKVKWNTGMEEYFIIYGLGFSLFDEEYHYELYSLTSGYKTRWEVSITFIETLINLIKTKQEPIIATHSSMNYILVI